MTGGGGGGGIYEQKHIFSYSNFQFYLIIAFIYSSHVLLGMTY